MSLMENLKTADPAVADAIDKELNRQRTKLELIASENIVSKAVLEAQGSVLTNKYAEGYPGKRYYGGCEFVDVVEQLAIDRAKKLFGAAYANVQPHSGAQANMAVFFALLQPGDTVILDSPHKIPPFTSLTGGPTDHRLQVGAEMAQWLADRKVQCVGFGDGVAIEGDVRNVKPFHDILMAQNCTFLEVLCNL